MTAGPRARTDARGAAEPVSADPHAPTDAGGAAGPVSARPSAPRRHRRRRTRGWRRHRRLLFSLAGLAALVVLAVALAVVRYLPLLSDVRDLQATVETATRQATAAGLSLDRPTLDELQTEFNAANARLDHLDSVVRSDPLIGLLRILPPTRRQIEGVDTLLAAGRDLARAGKDGLSIAGRYVAIRAAHAADPAQGSTMAQLVQLMATSTSQAADAAQAVDSARKALATLPPGLVGPLEHAATTLRDKVNQFGPPLDAYVSADGVLPAIAGWDGQRRYLVLAEDPAELRPTGGFAGTYGIVTFDGGHLTSHEFHNTLSLDLRPGQPYVTPPAPLKDHLLGKYPWQLADANWSPDFPTSAQDALRLYTLESGDSHIDGVIALTTYAIDDLLNVTGPIAVPEYNTTVTPGQTTLQTLKYTRQALIPGVDRKVFLQVFATHLLDALLALPTHQWPALITQLGVIDRQAQAMAWFKDPAGEALVTKNGWGGQVLQTPGDYVYAVDANVAPASKYNLVTQRSEALNVQLDAVGDAHDTLQLTWNNDINGSLGREIRAMPATGTSTDGVMGDYVRVLVPERSRLQRVSGGSYAALTAPEEITQEAGRTAFGNFLLLPPGTTHLSYSWISPYPADVTGQNGSYTLTVQKQPGTVADPFSLEIDVPQGAVITSASPGLTVSGETATLSTTLTSDLQVTITYVLPGG